MRKIEGLGKVSCSRMSSVMGSATSWITYRADIRMEWALLGNPDMLADAIKNDETFAPRAIRHGLETEDRALAEFQIRHPDELPSILGGSNVLIHPHHPWFCGTPDLPIRPGIFPATGVEVKCPVNQDRHVLKSQPLPTEHYPQIQGYIELTSAVGWWFVSYYVPPEGCSRHDQGGTFYTERWVKRDDAYTGRMMARAEQFWAYCLDDDEESVFDYYPESPGFENLSAMFR